MTYSGSIATANSGSSASGYVEMIAGTGTGINSVYAGFTGTNPPLATSTKAPPNDIGAITLKQNVDPGANGNIVLVTSSNGSNVGGITQTAPGTLGGSGSTGILTNITLRDAGAPIDLAANGPNQVQNNSMSNINLFSCLYSGCPGPTTSPPFTTTLTGPPIVTVPTAMFINTSGGTVYANGPLSYSSNVPISTTNTGGTNVVGIGTTSNLTFFTPGTLTLTGLVVSASSLTFEADVGINISLQNGPIIDANITSDTGYLKFLSGGNINYTSTGPGFTIGTSPASPFNRDLYFIASGSINLQNALYIGKGNLLLSANTPITKVLAGTTINPTDAKSYNFTGTPNGIGSVTMSGNNLITVGHDLTVTAQNFSMAGGVAAGASLQNQSPGGQQLIVNGTVNLDVPGDVTVAAGPANMIGATPYSGSASISATGINIGSSSARANSLTLTGGKVCSGGSTLCPNNQTVNSDANITASGSLNISLGAGGLTLGGGTATLGTGGGTSGMASADATLKGGTTTLDVTGNVTLQGGTGDAQGGRSAANTDIGASASASVISGGAFAPNVGGTLTMTGGLSAIAGSTENAGVGNNSHAVANSLLKGGSSLNLIVGNGIALKGGNATTAGSGTGTCLGGGGVCATAVALITSDQADQKITVTNGNFTITGGSASAGDLTTSANALAGVDPPNQSTLATTLTITTLNGGVIMTGGSGLTGVQTPSGTAPGVASGAAIIFSPGAIAINGGVGGLKLNGAQGSGLFQNIALSNSIVGLDGTVPPISISGGYLFGALSGADAAFVLSGAPPNNLDPLLSGLLFAIDQSKSARIAYTLADTSGDGKDKNYCK